VQGRASIDLAPIPAQESKNMRIMESIHMKRDRFLFLIPMVGIFVFWEATSRIFLEGGNVPPPSEVVATLFCCLSEPSFLVIVLRTFLNLSTGIILALLIAVPVALATGLREKTDNVVTPLIMLAGSLPDLALIPLFAHFLGPGDAVAILMSSICAFFPIYFTVRGGVKAIPIEYFHVSRIFGKDRVDTFMKMILPAISPYIISGLRISFDFVWEIVLAIEIFAGVSGIGSFINRMMSTEFPKMEYALAGIMVIGCIAVTADRLLFGYLESKIRRWA